MCPIIPRPPKPVRKLPLKEWVALEAQRLNIGTTAIHQRMKRGYYPDLALERFNKRVIYVLNP